MRKRTLDEALSKCSHLQFHLSNDSARDNLVELGRITGKLSCSVLYCWPPPHFHYLCLAQGSRFSYGLISGFRRLHVFPKSHLTFYGGRPRVIPVTFSQNGLVDFLWVHFPWFFFESSGKKLERLRIWGAFTAKSHQCSPMSGTNWSSKLHKN